MSDDTKQDFANDLKQAAELEKKIAEVKAIELEVRQHKALAQKHKIDEANKNYDLSAKASYGLLSDDKIKKLQHENTAYIEAAQNSLTFIDSKTFKGVVPFFRKNLIFIGAKTGEGKSTAVANIVRQLISEVNPFTKKFRRLLVITNEEKAEDFYNRITCLIFGWHYVNHDKFTPQQLKTFNDYLPLLARLVTVIADDHNGGSGCTTSVEGFEQIMENLIRNEEWYDAILIDYYQNFTYSQKDPTMNEWAAQAKLANLLDRYKNIYPAPIVIFGQITPAEEGKENTKPFEYRIKGRKQILVPATFAMEMVAERGLFRTSWIIHKGRFSEEVGKTIYTGYDKGRFVAYDQAFKEKTLKAIEDKQRQAMNRAAGVNFMDVAKQETPEQTAKGVAGEPVEDKKDATEVPQATSSN